MKKIFIIGFASLIILSIGFSQLAGYPEPLPSSLTSTQMLKSGPFKVSSKDITLVDKNRGLQAHDEFEGRDIREIESKVWWPKEGLDEPRPLLIYNHGFMSNLQGGAHVAEFMASHGYVVAAMTFPMTNMLAPGGPYVNDVVNQPADVSFLIDTLLAASSEQGNDLYEGIDPQRIAVMGLSLGGMTTSLVSFHPDLFDSRIKTSISVAGPGSMFTEEFYAHNPIPFMMIASKIDAMISFNENAGIIPDYVPGSTLVSFNTASHAGFAHNARSLRFFENPDNIGCVSLRYALNDIDPTQNMLEGISGEGIGIIIPDPETAMPCREDILPAAMNVIRQQELQLLAVRSFLEMQFSTNGNQRDMHQQFLYETYPSEHDEIEVIKSLVTQTNSSI